MSTSSPTPSVCSILDIPNEILTEIILYCNARERLALGNSCQIFDGIVFTVKKLLRDLDFSQEWWLTSEADIQRYFKSETTCKHIYRLNIASINAENILNGLIGKAINLVDLNIHGTKIGYVTDLHSLLSPLIHLKRLSLNWPILGNYDDRISNKVLSEPLSRLIYLSIELPRYSHQFLFTLEPCQQLEELRLYFKMSNLEINTETPEAPKQLKNIKIIQFRGRQLSRTVKNNIIPMIPSPAQWTDFHLVDPDYEGYLEKNVEACEELQHLRSLRIPARHTYMYGCFHRQIGWHLLAERLMKAVIAITHEDVPKKFCCLTDIGNVPLQPCSLKLDEAKKLLKDPRYPVSYLNFAHVIDKNCDAHLLASVFPNLTELVILRLGNRNICKPHGDTAPARRRFRKRGSTAPMEPNVVTESESSFKLLIENSPQLKGLTISPSDRFSFKTHADTWDLTGLDLIPGWKNLTTVCFRDIPIRDGRFLVNIGKECTNLEEILLYRLGSRETCCYTGELREMLSYCKNLKKISICQRNMENIPYLLASFTNNLKLERIRLMTKTNNYDPPEMISSFENLLHQCPALIRFVFLIQSASDEADEQLKIDLERIVAGLNRRDFRFYGLASSKPCPVLDNTPKSFFPTLPEDKQFTYRQMG